MFTLQVSTILEQATASFDVRGDMDWFSILAAKVSHSHFDELCDTIMREGFTLPIVLVPTDEDENGEETYTIGNGHHRLCAAILLGLESIPVIIDYTGDYWRMEDSHDGEWNPGARSFDYWNMLCENIPAGYSGDEYNETHRNQFTGDEACDVCGYGECECCDDCGGYPCDCNNECPECWGTMDDHLFACRDRDYDFVWCEVCYTNHYACLPCEVQLAARIDDAYAEHQARGFFTAGAWHPAYILDEAYAEQAEYVEAEARNRARAAWVNAVDNLRQAVRDETGFYSITHLAMLVTIAGAAYNAL